MALVNHNQVKEAGRKLTKDFLTVLRPGQGLIQAEIDFIRGVNPPLAVNRGAQVLGGAVRAFDGPGPGRQLGHGRTERPEIVDHGLVNQDVAVGQKQDALLAAGLPQPPDNLKDGVGLARSGGHDQQEALAALGNSLDGGVDGVDLIVARGLPAAAEIILRDNILSLGFQVLPGTMALPQVGRRGKGVQAEVGFPLRAQAGPVVEHKALAIGGKNKGDMQRLGIVQGLLHAVTHRVNVVLGFNQGNGEIGLVIQDVIGPLGLAPADQFATHDAAYLALAESLPAPLITCDTRLAAAPGHRASVELVQTNRA